MKDKLTKRKEAEQRNSAWANMTPEKQLAYLDSNNLVATKQRNKIQKISEKK